MRFEPASDAALRRLVLLVEGHTHDVSAQASEPFLPDGFGIDFDHVLFVETKSEVNGTLATERLVDDQTQAGGRYVDRVTLTKLAGGKLHSHHEFAAVTRGYSSLPGIERIIAIFCCIHMVDLLKVISAL